MSKKDEYEENEPDSGIAEFYEDFIPLFQQFNEKFELVEALDIEDEDALEGIVLLFFSSITCEILITLYNQTISYLDVDPENYEEYSKYVNWLTFWALMFYDGDDFREAYDSDDLQDMPESWDSIVDMVDLLLEDEDWEEDFSDILFDFSENVIKSFEELQDSFEMDWDTYVESVNQVMDSFHREVVRLESALDRATDYLLEITSDGGME